MPAMKKDPSVRQRRNVAPSAATLSSAATGPAPELPNLPDRVWSPLTRSWWSDLWASPMSHEYHDSDQHQLGLLAMLMDDFFAAETPRERALLSAEIRHHRMSFGLTPYDRRRLEWQIETTEDAKDRGQQRRTRRGTPQPSAGDDPRSVLRAV